METTIVYNSQPRLIEGPTIKDPEGRAKVCRFTPGNNEVPAWYVKGCKAHKQGKKRFENPPYMLRELTPQETPPAPPQQSGFDNVPNAEKPVDLPQTLNGFSAEDAMPHILAAKDCDMLIQWGRADEREDIQGAILSRLNDLGYGLGG